MFARSPFANIHGEAEKKELHAYALEPSPLTSDTSNFIETNSLFTAVPWRGAGGRLAVFSNPVCGRVPADVPILDVTKLPVSDLSFCPHDDNVLAVGSEDGELSIVRLEVPDSGAADAVTAVRAPVSIASLPQHAKRASVMWHPFVSQLLVSSSLAGEVRISDVEKGSTSLSHHLGESVYSATLAPTGSLLGVTTRDRMLCILDPRANEKVATTQAHDASRTIRSFWVDDSTVATTGNAENVSRQIRLWDLRSMKAPLATHGMDPGAGLMMPIFDADLGLLILPTRGECQIRTFDIRKGSIAPCALITAPVQITGIALAPKKTLNVMSHQVMNLTILSGTKTLYRMSLTLPRKSNYFQDDIFVPVIGSQPSMTADEWLRGANIPPIRISLRPDGVVAQSEVASEQPRNSVSVARASVSSEKFADSEKVAMKRLNDKMNQFGGAAPVNDNEGVDDAEWDDE